MDLTFTIGTAAFGIFIVAIGFVLLDFFFDLFHDGDDDEQFYD